MATSPATPAPGGPIAPTASAVPAPATPAVAPAVTAPAGAPATPPPPPPPGSTTSYAPWGGFPSLGPGLTGWYTNLFLIVLGYLVAPLLLAALCNTRGWEAGVWTVIILSVLLDTWVIFHPWSLLGVSIAGYIRGQIGGSPGLDVSEGVDRAWEWIKKTYGIAAIVILGKLIALVALAFLPLDGYGGGALAVLAMVLPVIIGTVYFGGGAWVIRGFWQFYIWILVILMAYWILAGFFFPSLRHSPAYAKATATQQVIRNQNDAWLKEQAQRIGKLLERMPANLSEEERVAKLSKEEQAVWVKAVDSGFITKSQKAVKETAGPLIEGAREKLAPGVNQAKGAVQDLQKWVSGVTTGPGGCLTSFTGVYEPSAVKGPMLLGDRPFCAGNYRYETVGRGVHQQAYNHEPHGAYTRYINCDGSNPQTGQAVHTMPDHVLSQAPLPKEVPHGTCFLRETSGGQVVGIGKGMEFTLQTEAMITIGKNVIGQGWDYDGPGQIRIKIVSR